MNLKSNEFFLREWPDGSNIKISFIEMSGPLIDVFLKQESPHKKEIDEISQFFYGKRFDNMTEEFLKLKGFKKQTS